MTIWDAPNLSLLAITSKCTLPLLLLLVLSLWSQDLHQQKNFKNISSPLFPFLDRERGKREIQDCSKLWKKRRGASSGSITNAFRGGFHLLPWSSKSFGNSLASQESSSHSSKVPPPSLAVNTPELVLVLLTKTFFGA